MNEIQVLPLHLLRLDPANARAPADDPGLNMLASSLAEQGQINPIVVRHDRTSGEPGYLVSIGSRRFRAAEQLGWQEIKAVVFEGEDADIEAMSAAENLAREEMHPVDEWLAVKRQMEQHGWDMLRVARALGIGQPEVKIMRALSTMCEPMLKAIRLSPELPGIGHLRSIANATHTRQEDALAFAKGKPITEWHRVAQACAVRRAMQSDAVFDISLITWDEDMFAQPGDELRFTTTEVKTFIKHQEAALKSQAKASGGRIEIVEPKTGERWIFPYPVGWEYAYEQKIPKRWKKDDTRRVFKMVDPDDGSVMTRVGQKKLVYKDREAANGNIKEPRPTIAKATQRDIAQLKRRAVIATVPGYVKDDPASALHVLLLALLADNVDIAGGYHAEAQQIAKALIDADGTPRIPADSSLAELAGLLINRIAVFRAPEVPSPAGAAAEWVALAIGATMPRCDTEEILKGVAGDELKRLAEEGGIDPKGTVAQVRARCVGHLPDWRPNNFGPAISATLSGYVHDDEDDDQAEDEVEAAE